MKYLCAAHCNTFGLSLRFWRRQKPRSSRTKRLLLFALRLGVFWRRSKSFYGEFKEDRSDESDESDESGKGTAPKAHTTFALQSARLWIDNVAGLMSQSHSQTLAQRRLTENPHFLLVSFVAASGSSGQWILTEICTQSAPRASVRFVSGAPERSEKSWASFSYRLVLFNRMGFVWMSCPGDAGLVKSLQYPVITCNYHPKKKSWRHS